MDETGARVFGLRWLVVAAGFIVAGPAVLTLRSCWRSLTLGVTLLSQVVTVLGWPDAWFGVFVNLVILAYLFTGGEERVAATARRKHTIAEEEVEQKWRGF